MNGCYQPSFVQTTELVGTKHTALLSIIINFPFVIGELLTIAVAYNFRNFRHMLRVLFIPVYVFAFVLFFLVPESPRWLVVKRK